VYYNFNWHFFYDCTIFVKSGCGQLILNENIARFQCRTADIFTFWIYEILLNMGGKPDVIFTWSFQNSLRCRKPPKQTCWHHCATCLPVYWRRLCETKWRYLHLDCLNRWNRNWWLNCEYQRRSIYWLMLQTFVKRQESHAVIRRLYRILAVSLAVRQNSDS